MLNFSVFQFPAILPGEMLKGLVWTGDGMPVPGIIASKKFTGGLWEMNRQLPSDDLAIHSNLGLRAQD